MYPRINAILTHDFVLEKNPLASVECLCVPEGESQVTYACSKGEVPDRKIPLTWTPGHLGTRPAREESTQSRKPLTLNKEDVGLVYLSMPVAFFFLPA